MKDMKEKQAIQISAISSSEQITHSATLPHKAPPIAEPNELDPKEKIESEKMSLTEIGVDHFEAKHYAEALKYFNQALIRNPHNKRLWTACGITLNHLGRHSESLHYFQYALQKEGMHYEKALLNRGLAWTKLGEYGNALNDFTSILTKNANHKVALHYKGNALLFSGQTEFAISTYLASLSHDSNDPEIWYNLGCAFQKLNLSVCAIFCYAQTLHKNHQHADALTNSAHANFMLGKYKEAIPFFRYATQLAPNDIEAWTNLGVTYEKLANYFEAFHCFKQALQIKSDYAPAKVCQEHLKLTVSPESLSAKLTQKSDAENIKIALVFADTKSLLSDLQKYWATYKKGQLKSSLKNSPPPPRPPTPVFFSDPNLESEKDTPTSPLNKSNQSIGLL